ncbi:unnamed protein product [Toxocara canis]|uniref:Solute carrier family 2, facilitated glucose transporter member 7 n=1 Tax=Toxocara canis TaxID=6265 RepID=A0A183UF83_TOXCA|nr:unnamed protein product [Toxocara canis]
MNRMNRRLAFVTLTHATLGSFGDIEATVFNLMSVPLKSFFNESITAHYGEQTAESFSWCFSMVASLSFAGLLVGAFAMGYLMDYVGRKQTAVILRSSLGIISGVCMFIAKPFMSFELFAIGHFLAGIICAFRIVLIIYMVECSPDNVRGLTSMAMSSGSTLALLVATPLCLPSVFGNSESWIYLPAICSIMAFLHLSIAIFFPQSPKHLFICNLDTMKTKEAVTFYHGSATNFDAIEEEYDQERLLLSNGHTSLSEVLSKHTLRWSFTIVMVCAFVPSTSAINVKSVYQAAILMSFGFDETQAMFALMAVGLISSPFCFATPFIIEKIGRRPLFLSVSALCVLEWFFLGAAEFLVDEHSESLLYSEVLGMIGSISGSMALMLGLLVLTPIMISELCPHPSRAIVTQVSTVVSILFVIVSVQVYPLSVEQIGFVYHLTMLLLSSVCFVLLYRYLPETKGLPIDQIVRQLSFEHRQADALLRNQEMSRSSTYGSVQSSMRFYAEI